jgi:Mrp family chromosome partitioning ATPase
VLLIDADLRRPAVARNLGAESNERGLLQLLGEGGRDLADHVTRVAGTRLDILGCESRQSDTYEVLHSPALRTLFDRAREMYTLVVVDTPPVVPVPDSNLLGGVVDGYIVVISANATPRKLLGEALSLLDASEVLGLVLNRDARPLFGHYGTYHDAYFRQTAKPSRVGA